jgi:uncharacterized spore protein YtfJ
MSQVIGERAVDGAGVRTAAQVIERLARTAQPDVVFGQPVERGEVTVIPCAEIMLGMGMGSGSGASQATEKAPAAGGEGAGSGGAARGRPVAAIIITRDAVRVEPIVDVTRVALAGLTTAGFMAFWLARLAGALRSQPANMPTADTTIGAPAPSLARLVRALRR